MRIILYFFCSAVFFSSCNQNVSPETIAGTDATVNSPMEDSIAFRKANIEKWYQELQSNYDSAVSFAFYMQKDYLELKRKVDKYEKFSEEEKLVDELNDNMFAGGDPDHRYSHFFNLGEVGHFFEEAKKELNEKEIKYIWNSHKARYELVK